MLFFSDLRHDNVNCVPLPPLPRSLTRLFWELHGGLLPGWGASYSGGRGAVLCSSDTPPAPGSGVTRGDVHNCPHAAHRPTSGGAQELLQWRHPAWLYWRRDTHLSRTEQRLHIFIHFKHRSCLYTRMYNAHILYFFFLYVTHLFACFPGIQPTSTFFFILRFPSSQPWTSCWLTFNPLTLPGLSWAVCYFHVERNWKGRSGYKPQRGQKKARQHRMMGMYTEDKHNTVSTRIV